ncbi:hypothetical protein RJ639_030353 [Escallonia herrerae]|uniref:Alliinase C-terminal domain-containing protein n=1 Tax=Escallonia herrerae TaxID=1293975 RepID=A0AA89BD71_9ASTE|nr:hypothetical protein RJ639_030353 [Escallonia herrerae]
MGKVSAAFSLKHVLVLSLALNVGLILRFLHEGGAKNLEKENRDTAAGAGAVMASKEAHAGMTSSSSAGAAEAVAGGGDDGSVINLDHGDPTMYERFWQQMGDKTTVVIPGWQYISYFSNVRNLCWFLEPEFANAVVNLHKVVGNAIADDHHIVVGTGSTQLFQAVLYALSPADSSEPMSVVSAAPYYSSYPLQTDYLKSGLYKWAGDAYKFSKDTPYIELVTSPNNPDGSTRQAVVNQSEGIRLHDLAYYWPQYTPISFPADHDIMLFTVSKSTGHAGTRIGWALIRDREIAKKMTKFIEINTIGVSKDSQLRAAKVLQAVSDSYDRDGIPKESKAFFEYGYNLMAERWRNLRAAVNMSGLFSLPDFPVEVCTFSRRAFEPQPAFAWLKCEGEIEDCESFIRKHKILTRGGKHFGVSPKYVRISMLDRDEKFNLFTERLSKIHN